MNAGDKSVLFNLIKTASVCYNGYVKDELLTKPVFTDSSSTETKTETPQVQETPVTTAAPEQKEMEIKTDPVTVSGGMTIEQINQKIARCTRCPLARQRTNVVPGVGVTKPVVLVIGEAPGAEEDAQGIPFVGPAGQLLDKMLSAIKLSRNTNTYILNTVKCRPPENRNPLPEEMSACQGFMEAQIKVLKPTMILCVGKVAAQKLLESDLTLGNLRNQFFKYQDIPVLVTYHPSAVLRNEALKAPVWSDLKMFGSELKKISAEYAGLFGE